MLVIKVAIDLSNLGSFISKHDLLKYLFYLLCREREREDLTARKTIRNFKKQKKVCQKVNQNGK